jgi:hypothetical protein
MEFPQNGFVRFLGRKDEGGWISPLMDALLVMMNEFHLLQTEIR